MSNTEKLVMVVMAAGLSLSTVVKMYDVGSVLSRPVLATLKHSTSPSYRRSAATGGTIRLLVPPLPDQLLPGCLLARHHRLYNSNKVMQRVRYVFNDCVTSKTAVQHNLSRYKWNSYFHINVNLNDISISPDANAIYHVVMLWDITFSISIRYWRNIVLSTSIRYLVSKWVA